MYDLVIRGAQIADGLGSPLMLGDVAIEGKYITEIGHITGESRRTIEADGLVLSPGIVDVHTHYDAQLTWDCTATPSPSLGVTSIVVGNCGFSIAPCPVAHRDLIVRNLAEVEGMSLAALRSGTNWEFETFSEYLALLKRKGVTPNVAAFIGHSAVRTSVMGEEASERPASENEIAEMRQLVSAGMDAGAIGFSSSTSINHFGDGGVPMPSRLANEEELRVLTSVLGEKQRGVFQLTVGPSVSSDFLESIAEQNNCAVFQTAALFNDTFPDRAPKMVRDSAGAQARGNAMWAQVSCQPLSMEFDLMTAFPMQSLDSWHALIDLDKKSFKRKIKDQSFRASFRNDLEVPKEGKLFYGDWSKVEVAMVGQKLEQSLEGMTIEQISKNQEKDPVDVFETTWGKKVSAMSRGIPFYKVMFLDDTTKLKMAGEETGATALDAAISLHGVNIRAQEKMAVWIENNMPKEFIEQSNKELAAINLAYDKIKEIRAKS